MTEEFKEILSNSELELFYNSNGNENAYKLFVRHISYAPSLGYGKIIRGSLTPLKPIFIVNFELECIEKVEDSLKIINLLYL